MRDVDGVRGIPIVEIVRRPIRSFGFRAQAGDEFFYLLRVVRFRLDRKVSFKFERDVLRFLFVVGPERVDPDLKISRAQSAEEKTPGRNRPACGSA